MSELFDKPEHSVERSSLIGNMPENSIFEKGENDFFEEKLNHLNQLNQHKDDLLTIIAHDLRSPIGTLSGLLDIYEELSFNEIKQVSASIKTTLKITTHLIDSLLQWVLAQRNGLQIKHESVSLSKLTEEVFTTLKILTHPDKNVFVNDIEKDSVLRTDVDILRLVLRNLLLYVNRFSEKQEIRIQAYQTEWVTFIKISDNFPENDLKLNKTELITQFPVRQIGKQEGLGLMLAQDFIVRLGGQIWVEKQPDRSVKTIFTIPKSF